MKNKFNNKFNNLPEEYFAQKFTNPKLPEMKPYTLRVSLVAMFIFYLVNCFVGCRSDYAVIRYSSYFAFAVAAVMLVLRVIFGQKMIRKYPVAFIRCCIYSFGELKLFMLSTFTIITANVLSDKLMGYSDELVVNSTYIFGAAMLLLDIIINLVFWLRMKKRIIAGAYKEDGDGFFGKMKNKDKIWLKIVKISGAAFTISYVLRLLSRGLGDFVYDISDYVYIPLLVLSYLALIFLFCVMAFGNSLLKGRMHYIRKFGLGSTFEDVDIQ